MKVYCVQLSWTTNEEDKLFTNAKAARENFNAVKRRLPPEFNRYLPGERNERHFTEYYTQEYTLILSVKNITLDKPMSGPPRTGCEWLKKKTLVEHTKYVAKQQRGKEATLAKLYRYMKYYYEDAFIEGRYENKIMTFKVHSSDSGIVTMKAKEKPNREGFYLTIL